MRMPKEVITPTQRCPKCQKLTLSFDPDTKTIRCSACGYEEKLRT